ncbi:uncharacterized protein LTR77_007329 [Saxophila tyrrhenica]|uniref:Utp8 beta-propeller domain-containing protein n=1 Tax=Saxophila tyrrhenica TaxID=1690608 RepID=A0AAV9P8D3_9PEZI|nr:hypothetical protein LTR77_007329 [Saxophila tyrrhenica]
MADAALEAPYSIATLPRPLDTKCGRTRSAPVYSIRESKKRKRQEVVVGVDGESVNIYNIQSQRLVTSYALPPQTYLCCSPCSFYTRGSTTSPSQRTTYLIIKDNPHDPKRRLICFTEDVRRKGDSTPKVAAPQRRECSLDDGDVLNLEMVPAAAGRPSYIAASYNSGKTLLVSHSMQSIEKIQRPDSDDLEDYTIEHAAFLDVGSAKKGVLKSREDVLAVLDQDTTHCMLLSHVARIGDKRYFQLFGVKTPDQASLQTFKTTISMILDVKLPELKTGAKSPAWYSLHAASGTLYQLVLGKLHVVDLSGTIPKPAASFGGGADQVTGFARLSSTLTMAASKSGVALYETRYGSVYGSLSFTTSASGLKSKRSDGDDDEESAASIDELSESLKENKAARLKGTRLADVVTKAGSHSVERTGKPRKWKEWTTVVDRLVDADDIEGLERLVANDQNTGHQGQLQAAVQRGPSGKPSAAERKAYEDRWPLPITYEPAQLDRSRALYILSKVFSSSESGVQVRVLSQKLLEWLALAGFLSAASVRRAWSEFGGGHSSITISPGSILAALQPFDEDFQLLADLLSLPVHWEIEEVVEALRSAIQSFEEPIDGEAEPLALPPIPQQPNGDVAMANGDMPNGETDSHIKLESEAAEHELDHALATLSNGLDVKSVALRVIFSRLTAFDPDNITARLRTMMSHRELIFFIHLLRIELADGGWTSRYIGTGSTDEEEEEQEGLVNAKKGAKERGPANEALRTIADLLNCAVDAIGTSGWLVGLSSTTGGAQDLLASLRAEVSAGLEGCYEANTLGMTLGEIQRFAMQAKREELPGFGKGHLSTSRLGREEGDALLPMGSRAAPAFVDGKKRKRAKDKGKAAQFREKSNRVGKYSFERIRI